MRRLIEQLKGRATSDGAGVKLLRVFGGAGPERFDPFLLLDEFGSEEASDYIGGFPAHPHRGFETVTYMLEGKMEHQDHMGNTGLLNSGDVQWMTAGKGIIHSEMPRQTEGKMRGFQLWVNLPANKKMTPAHYHDIKGENIPEYKLPQGKVKAIAGNAVVDNTQIEGFFDVPDTDIIYLDIHLDAEEDLTVSIAEEMNLLAYVYDGEIRFGKERSASAAQTLSRFEGKGDILVQNDQNSISRVLILAGRPLKEPVVQHGPFVMNTQAEIEQAILDYREGVLTN